MGASDELTQFINNTVQSLCDLPQMVKTELSQPTENTACFLVSCDPTDLSKVIGSKGRNIESLRTLLKAIAAKHRLKAVLVLKE